jgi:hypothetical protein
MYQMVPKQQSQLTWPIHHPLKSLSTSRPTADTLWCWWNLVCHPNSRSMNTITKHTQSDGGRDSYLQLSAACYHDKITKHTDC